MPSALTRVVAKMVLFDENGQILIIQRSETDDRRPLQWDVPGGAVDEGEDYLAAAIREAEEEVGITIDPANAHIVYATSDMTEKGNVIWVYFVARVQNQDPVLSHEHSAFDWIPLAEVPAKFEYERQINALGYIKAHNLLPAAG